MKRFLKQWLGIKNKHQAHYAKQRLAILYAFVGWNCFGLVFYVLLKNRIPQDSTGRRESYRNLTGVHENIHVYQVTGMTLKNDFDMVRKLIIGEEEKGKETERTAEEENVN